MRLSWASNPSRGVDVDLSIHAHDEGTMPGSAPARHERARVRVTGAGSELLNSPTWRQDHVFAMGSRTWMVHLGVVALTYLNLRLESGTYWAGGWAGGMVAATVVLAVASVLYHRLASRHEARAKWFGNLHSGITASIGILWGVGAVGVARDAPDELLFYTLVLGGTALGAVSSQHPMLRSCMLSVWTSIPPLALAHYMNAPGIRGGSTAAMMLLFGITLTVLAVRLNRFLAANVSLIARLDDKVVELEQARRAADDANAAKSRLLAQASHDLRQPIHAVGLLVECLRDEERDPEALSIIARIDRSLDGLARLFRSLLDVAALDMGRIRPQQGVFDLGRVVADVARQSSEAARERGVHLRSVAGSAWVHGDAGLVHTVVQNLVSNAIKYAPNARVLVGCRRRGRTVSVEVHDTGPGIAAEDQQRIFDEFVRLQPAGRAKSEGLGLGLSIVRRLAALLGLTVGLRSTPGRGSAFRVDGFVSADPPPGNADEVRPRDFRNLLAGFRVIVVDDDAAVRDGMAGMLARWGCLVTACGQPPQGPIDADFLIVDQILGEALRGVSILEDLAAKGKLPPAAIVTGAVETDLEDRARVLDVPVLMKPVRPAELRSLLLTAASGGP
ncbi:MAG: hybrid sensor histidine kinase/response regulator [Rhodospirillales bacterium]|nr:hybrid sensor histidine kinase/response regulator [Rhodospirillales bacterium]